MAWHLLEQGHEVTLVDRQADAAMETSFANGAQNQSLKALVAATGIEYHRLERGILRFFSSQADMDAGAEAARLMREFGVDRRILDRTEVLAVEPALASCADRLVGGIYTPSDESGDACVFTQALARRCAERGLVTHFQHDVQGLNVRGGRVHGVVVRSQRHARRVTLAADAVVVALGSFTAPLLRQVGVNLNIYPAKGYSATFKLRHPERASTVSMIDDARKIAISRLGDTIRVAGTAELAGYDARVRCDALRRRYEELLPGVADTTEPNFWAGLGPSTPTNIPYIGQTPVAGLWVNAGHGTLGWTHGAGSGRVLAELISGGQPDLDFGFYGVRRAAAGWCVVAA